MIAKIKQKKTLPKTARSPGTVHRQMVRCGRANCKCARGELHGPYIYRFWREGGKLHKAYVKQPEVGDVLASLNAGRSERVAERRRRQGAEGLGCAEFRRLLALIRELQGSGVTDYNVDKEGKEHDE